MKINVKTVKGKIFQIEVTPETKIEDIKTKVQSNTDIEPVFQKLIFKGKHLSDEKTLTELKVKDNDNLILMTIKKKAVKKEVKEVKEEKPDPPIQEETVPVENQPQNPKTQNESNQQNPVNQQQIDPNNEVVNEHANKEAMIVELEGMGFDRLSIEQALAAAFYDKQRAIDYLINVD